MPCVAAEIVPLFLIAPKKVETILRAMPLPPPEMTPLLVMPPLALALALPNAVTLSRRMPFGALIVPPLSMPP